MKKLTVAFLYNVRHKYPDPNDISTQMEADFDDLITIKAMVKNLKACGFNVIPIEANERAYFKLYKNKQNIDIAFNYSEGLHGNDREAQMPAMLEMLQIPYVGCRPLTSAILLNKAKTKEILSTWGIPVLPHQIFKNENEKLKNELSFPLIAKPLSQGSSSGITNDSIVFNAISLKKQIKLLTKKFKSPAIVEPYLEGREFSVPMMGNPPIILPIIEPNHTILPKNLHPIDSLEVKWHFEEGEGGKDYLMCPAKINENLKTKINNICQRTWNALGITDICRIDIRCDKKNNPYVLEVNFPVGLIPPEIAQSYFVFSALKKNINYQNLLKTIISSTLKCYANKTLSKRKDYK